MTARPQGSLRRLPRGVSALIFLVCLIALIAGVLLSPRRTAAAFLIAYSAATSTVLGALALLMIAHLTNATWFVSARRISESMVASLPALALMTIPLLAMSPLLFPWMRASGGAITSDLPNRSYLNTPFFLARTIVYWSCWLALSESWRRASREQEQPPHRAPERFTVLSAAGLPVLALTMTFAAFDWMMSITPQWASTIYGLYWIAGGLIAGLSAIVVVGGIAHHRLGIPAISTDHVHALARLLLTFVLLWAYFGYSQYIVVWSADLPREVTWYLPRVRGAWGGIALLLIVGNLVVPFLLLLLRAVKRSSWAVAALGVWLLAMHVIDTEWVVRPSLGPASAVDALLTLAALGVVVFVLGRTMIYRDTT